MKTILIPAGWYLPGFRAGGPVRSISNMVEALSDSFTFRVIAFNRDLGERHSYESIVENEWVTVGSAEVLYLPLNFLTPWRTVLAIRRAPYDLIYFPSFFSFSMTVVPLVARKLGFLPCKPIVIAPRGQFGDAALSVKKVRKAIYRGIGSMLGLWSGTVFHVTSKEEVRQVEAVLGRSARRAIFNAPNIPTSVPAGSVRERKKEVGTANVLFLGRISRIKNLSFALEVVVAARTRVHFLIVGPVEDEAYWEQCKKMIARLPAEVRIEYGGALPHRHVIELLSATDLVFLPTGGENFGHAIVEALAVGCPVLTSDQTPWSEIHEAGAGWALPLADKSCFVAAIREMSQMDDASHGAMRARARSFFRTKILGGSANEHRKMFRHALSLKQG